MILLFDKYGTRWEITTVKRHPLKFNILLTKKIFSFQYIVRKTFPVEEENDREPLVNEGISNQNYGAIGED